MRILELDLMAPARYTGYLMALLGAEVINVEAPARADDGKSLRFRDDGDSRWLWYQQGKKSICLDLKSDAGHEVLLRMADKADGVIEGFRPGAAARLGLDAATLIARNPQLVYVSVTGFGQTGPLSALFGRETAYGALTGLLDLTRPRDGAPYMLPFLITDIVGGTTAAVAMLAALVHAKQTGYGQHVDAAAYDAMFPFLGMRIHDLQLGSWFGSRPRHVESGLETMDVFSTADGRFIVFTADNDRIWTRFCEAAQALELLPLRNGLDRDATEEERQRTRKQLTALFLSRSLEDWIALNERSDVGLAPVLSLSEVMQAPHTAAREMMVDAQHPRLGSVRTTGVPFKFERTPAAIGPYPAFGADTREVLESFGIEDWERLLAAGAVS